MLEQLGYPDAKIMDEVVKGFPLTGWAEQSGVFMPDVRPPEMDITQLKGMSLGLNHAVVEALKNSEPSELDAPAWEKRSRKWTKGGFDHVRLMTYGKFTSQSAFQSSKVANFDSSTTSLLPV